MESRYRAWREDAESELRWARNTLRGKPVFGDEEQIRADRFLTQVREFAKHLSGCANCLRHTECPVGMPISPLMYECAWLVMHEQGQELSA